MTDYKKAYQEIDKEMNNDKLELFKKEVKAYKLEQLEAQERLKSEKEKIEEKLRIVKLNLDNLDAGKFEAIEERMRKSEMARQLTVFNWTGFPNVWDTTWTSGTFTLPNGKIFYF